MLFSSTLPISLHEFRRRTGLRLLAIATTLVRYEILTVHHFLLLLQNVVI